jgi:hypothetical protein
MPCPPESIVSLHKYLDLLPSGELEPDLKPKGELALDLKLLFLLTFLKSSLPILLKVGTMDVFKPSAGAVAVFEEVRHSVMTTLSVAATFPFGVNPRGNWSNSEAP